MDKDVILQSLTDIKYVICEFGKIRSAFDVDDEEYYHMETIIVFMKLIYCKLRNMIMRDEEIKKIIIEKKI